MCAGNMGLARFYRVWPRLLLAHLYHEVDVLLLLCLHKIFLLLLLTLLLFFYPSAQSASSTADIHWGNSRCIRSELLSQQTRSDSNGSRFVTQSATYKGSCTICSSVLGVSHALLSTKEPCALQVNRQDPGQMSMWDTCMR